MEPLTEVLNANGLSLGDGIARGAALVGAGVCMGIGALGPALGECYAAGKGLEAMGKIPEHQGMLLRNIIIIMCIGETTGIYALVISLLLIFATG
jgi:F-type H+-transporting ATPase subunit c